VTPEAAYAVCRAIARKKAKNFYYAFVALPASKRDAICAVYAFMRQADDLSDDETVVIADRRAALDAWLGTWHQAQAGAATADPVFVALLDAQRRFAIPSQLLDQLVQGTATDLDPQFSAYPTFADLYRYCYLVASVVGLVCIRIFGYLDPHAEKLAEETGIAFQLTNILRDVREDAERGRLYLPLEDLERCGVTANSMTGISSGRQLTPQQRQVLAMQAQRADEFYKSAEALLPLISPDSRAALWVLVTIYHRLLRHIEQRNFDVFSARIGVPAYEKLSILGCGLFKTLAQGVWA
jgi:phytoene synthase